MRLLSIMTAIVAPLCLLCLLCLSPARASDAPSHGPTPTAPTTPAAPTAPTKASEPPAKQEAGDKPQGSSPAGEKLRSLIKSMGDDKSATVQIRVGSDDKAPAEPAATTPPAPRKAVTANEYFSARAAAHRTAEADKKGSGAGHESGAETKNSAARKAGTEARTQHAHWSYDGPTGPQNWASLAPENQLCASGQRQSPIHIQDAETLPIEAMEALSFDYRPSSGSVFNNGHTIQFDFETDNFLVVRGTRYRLLQFHFHHPAEERVNYKGYAMVAHLVHRSEAGQLAVLAVLFDPGAANGEVQTVWSHMPLDVNDRVKVAGVAGSALDPGKLLPADLRYYQFFGSLTTPPCSEGVLWLVLKQPMSLSPQQIGVFAKLFPHNARPTQLLQGRIIKSAQ